MMSQADPIRVLIVEDHPALAYGAKLCLSNHSRVESVEIITTGDAVAEALERLLPQVVILDLHLPDMNGANVAQDIRDRSDAHIIIYTGDENWIQYYTELIELGISGIVPKNYPLEYLERSLDCILHGYAAIPLDVFHTLRLVSGVHRFDKHLSEREINILRLLNKEHTNQEIADALHVSSKTIENYLTRIYRKFGVESRYEATEVFKTLDLNQRV